MQKISLESKKSFNVEAKKNYTSLGAIRATILKTLETNPVKNKAGEDVTMYFQSILEQSKQKEKYKVLLKYVKASKTGKYNIWYTLNGLNKFSAEIQKEFAAIDKKQAKKAA